MAATSSMTLRESTAPIQRSDRTLDAPGAAPEIADVQPRDASRKVLVVEDNATNRLLISRMLTKYGCTISLVTNGAEAVEALTGPAGHDFDIVLMDIQMPELDGRAATRLVRAFEAAHSDRPRVPIIALTANGLPEDVTHYLADGMNCHVAKPIDWRRLLGLIDTLAPRPKATQRDAMGERTRIA